MIISVTSSTTYTENIRTAPHHVMRAGGAEEHLEGVPVALLGDEVHGQVDAEDRPGQLDQNEQGGVGR